MKYAVKIENIGGIYQGSAPLSEGLNAVRASNWQGKSSLIAALKAVMGIGKPLTEGEVQGYVEFNTGEETYQVELRQDGDTVVRSGQPYLTDDLTLVSADLFAFFDEGNKIREAVRRGENLEKLLTRPLDIENIDEQIADLKHEREQVQREQEKAEEATKHLPSVQERVTQLETKLDSLRAQRANIQTGRTESSELEQKRDELGDHRTQRSTVIDRIEQLESSIERTERELEDKRTELDDHEVPDVEDVADTLESRRSELQELDQDVELLQSVYSTNKRILEEDRLDLLTDVDRGLMGDNVNCWICGTEVEQAEVEEQIEVLGQRVTERQSEADNRRQRVEELQSKLDQQREAEQKATRLKREIDELEEKLVNRRQSLTSARERLEEIEDEIESLSEEVDELDEKVTDIESDIKVAEHELKNVREELNTLQAQANRHETLESEYDQLTDELNQLKNRRDRIKRQMRESFDESIQEIVDLFETGFDGAHLTDQFELVVAREGRQASLDTLSEGERELLGVIVALAGYEAFDVGEDVPIMLLDDLGGFDEGNLSTLIQYLHDRTELLVFTAYPEYELVDTSTIELSGWDLVSAQTGSSKVQ